MHFLWMMLFIRRLLLYRSILNTLLKIRWCCIENPLIIKRSIELNQHCANIYSCSIQTPKKWCFNIFAYIWILWGSSNVDVLKFLSSASNRKEWFIMFYVWNSCQDGKLFANAIKSDQTCETLLTSWRNKMHK